MPVYMVERELPGVTMEQLAAARESDSDGQGINGRRQAGPLYPFHVVPGDCRCMCLFEAPNPEHVKEANERAQIPFTRIVQAADLTPHAE